jgi:hypothetical protein
MGIVIAARAVYRACKAKAVFLHSPKPAQYIVLPTEWRADAWPKKMTGGIGATFPRLASRWTGVIIWKKSIIDSRSNL